LTAAVRDGLVALRVSGWLRWLILAFALAAAGALGVILWRPAEEVVLRTPAGHGAGGGAGLPETLVLVPARSAARLTGGYQLTGTLAAAVQGGRAQAQEILLEGRRDGAPVTFRGVLTTTNVVAGEGAGAVVGVGGALLEGALRIGTNPPVNVRQPYLPTDRRN
jgi:hypothetical protein